MAAPIITPEAVVLDLDRASVASRTLAITIDALALVGIFIALALLIPILGLGGGGMALVYLLASILLVLAYFCGFETLWQGRTLGKAALGLRVVGVDGAPVRFQQAFLRSVLGIVDFVLVPIGFIAVVSVLLSPSDQRLGDMAAGTLVVRERFASAWVRAAWFPPPPGYEDYVGSLDVAALRDEDYGMVRSYLIRSAELSMGAREHLARRIANPLAVRMKHTPPPRVHPHAFLICVAAAWQRAHGSAVPDPASIPRVAPIPGWW